MVNIFKDKALPLSLQQALSDMKFDKPTSIQEQAILPALDGQDILASAQTGTGKTAAFSIPLVAHAMKDKRKQFLILAPTRELAAQIRDVILDLTRHERSIRTVLLVGGAMMRRQLQQLKQRPSIIVATPGRLTDHLKRRSLSLDKCATLVLDEADRMLDMGFGPQIDDILEFVPKERQSLLFSATLPASIKKLAQRLMHEPLEIRIGDATRPADKVDQQMLEVKENNKQETLIEILEGEDVKTLVFVRTKRGADRLKMFLEKGRLNCTSIHGGRSQSQRERAISLFRSRRCNIMVATDVAARGLDVDGIELVINFDLPETPEDYIHRIGRTGRAEKTGRAISFVDGSETSHWKYIQNPDAPGAKKRSMKRRKPFRGNKGRGGRGSQQGRPSRGRNAHWKMAS